MAWHPFHIQAKLLYIAYDVIHTMVIYVDEGINADSTLMHVNWDLLMKLTCPRNTC